MSGASPASGDIFDVKRIRRLVELMNEHELSEIDLRQGEQRIKIRKGQEPVVSAPAPVAVAPPPAASAPASSPAPSPDAAPFVKVGDHVGASTTVCVIEAMKVFNEIPAETSGQIVAVLVENGEPVEFDQPLFKVDATK